MKYIKTIKDLFEKAIEREDGTANINGRMNYYGGGQGELQSKYRIAFTKNHVALSHWGTEIIAINTATEKVDNWYGESNSDRDAVNMLLYLLGMDNRYHAIYRPSSVGYKVVKVAPVNV